MKVGNNRAFFIASWDHWRICNIYSLRISNLIQVVDNQLIQYVILWYIVSVYIWQDMVSSRSKQRENMRKWYLQVILAHSKPAGQGKLTKIRFGLTPSSSGQDFSGNPGAAGYSSGKGENVHNPLTPTMVVQLPVFYIRILGVVDVCLHTCFDLLKRTLKNKNTYFLLHSRFPIGKMMEHKKIQEIIYSWFSH